jgi:hypothetical protein
MTPTHYQVVPLNEKPEKDGWYYFIEPATGVVSDRRNNFHKGEWYNDPQHYTHWLKPVEGILMTEEDLKEFEK